jgi:CheY-like chemotaxis protein
MTTLLLCSESPLEPALAGSALLRDGLLRVHASRLEEAHMMAIAAHPGLVLVDAELPCGLELVAALRQDPTTRPLSIAVLVRRAFETRDVAFLDAGANAVLPLPPARDFDLRLGRLLGVPLRREARLPVRLSVDSLRNDAVQDARALTLNLSESGMFLEASAPLRVGDEIAFALRLGRRGAAVGGSGRVVRQPQGTRYGVEFRALAGEGRQRIGQFIAQHA